MFVSLAKTTSTILTNALPNNWDKDHRYPIIIFLLNFYMNPCHLCPCKLAILICLLIIAPFVLQRFALVAWLWFVCNTIGVCGSLLWPYIAFQTKTLPYVVVLVGFHGISTPTNQYEFYWSVWIYGRRLRRSRRLRQVRILTIFTNKNIP